MSGWNSKMRILKYRQLARTAVFDPETSERINRRIAEMEQKLREIDERRAWNVTVGGWAMAKLSEKYRIKAMLCEKLALAATDSAVKTAWTEIAIEWHALASRVAKDHELEVDE
jgi:hypothetical protein